MLDGLLDLLPLKKPLLSALSMFLSGHAENDYLRSNRGASE
jgi:hypothetical protein